jgi:hypothetical protein
MEPDLRALPTVISYVRGLRDADVYALASKLTTMGVPCDFDRFELRPPGGWSMWMAEKMTTTEVVLVVCSEAYYKRYHRNEPRGVGQGATFESRLLNRRVLEAQGSEHGVIPILFDESDVSFVPEFLRDDTRFLLPRDFDDLYRVLTGQGSPYIRPPLGEIHRLPNIEPTPLAPSPRPTVTADVPRLAIVHHGGGLTIAPLADFSREGRMLRIVFAPRNASEASRLSALRSLRESIGVAYNLTALRGGIRAHREYVSDGRDLVEMQIFEEETNGNFEVSFNRTTADELAEYRARRILLDEKLPKRSGNRSLVDDLNEMSFDSFVSGTHSGASLVAKASPIPLMLKLEKGPEALAVARLVCVLLLQLTNVVERISRLELVVVPGGVEVEFSGVRRQQYQNVEAKVITISGICPISTGNE